MDKIKKTLKILSLSLLALVALFLIIPSRPVNRLDYEFDGVTARKQCILNMRAIQGAAELYYMEAGLSGELRLESPLPLVNGRYLNANIKCFKAAGPEYITVVKSPKDTVEVECALHGKLSEVETTGREKGIRKRSFFEKLFLDAVNQR